MPCGPPLHVIFWGHIFFQIRGWGWSQFCFQFGSPGKKYTPKVFSALKTQVPQQAKKRFGVYQKACFQGKKKENTYTPKSLQGVCGGPLRAVLVCNFLRCCNVYHVDIRLHYILVFDLIRRLCNLSLHYRTGFELTM